MAKLRIAGIVTCLTFLVILITAVSAFAADKTDISSLSRSSDDEILVKVKAGKDISYLTNSLGIKLASVPKKSGVQKIKLPKGTSVEAALQKFNTDPNVEYAERNYIRKLTFVPNDPQLVNQWAVTRVNAEQAWDISKGNPSVLIAVIDSGIDFNHPDLAGKIAGYYNSVQKSTDPEQSKDDYGHGTHVAGIAAAALNNGLGIAGIGGNVSLLDVKAGDAGSFYDSDIADGIYWAVDNGAKVINLSLGGYDYSQTLQDAVQYAIGKNVVVVAAAGNDGTDLPFYPAAYDGVIGVAASDETDHDAYFSNFGSYVDISAPGTSIYSTTPTYANQFATNYDYLDGTSMASPAVAGLAGLVISFRPDLGQSAVADVICKNAEDIDDPGWDEFSGWGRIDAYKTLLACEQPVTINSVVTDKPNPQVLGTSVQVTASASGGNQIYYQFWVNDGNAWSLAQDYSTGSTFNWTPTAAGDYKISVYAKDKNSTADADDVKIINYTIAAQSIEPVKLNSVFADKATPQQIGSTIRISAVASGGIQRYYQFWLNDGKAWSVVQDYSTSSTFDWTPAVAGDYKMAVYVKDKFSPNDPDDLKVINYSITDQAVQPVTIQSITGDQQSPQVKGTTVKFTTNAAGGIERYYQYWLNDGKGWTLLRDYSTDNTINWTPATAGNYRISVYARDKYSTNDADDVKIIGYTILDQAVAPVKLDGFTVDTASPQVKGTTVKFTASASGGTQVMYQFWLNAGTGWQVVQDYSLSNSFAWTPSVAGDYKLAVYAKDQYSTNDADDLKLMAYSVLDQTIQPVKLDSVMTDKTSPQLANTTISISANASGGIERYFQFWVNDGSGWKLAKDYSTDNVFNWTPISSGNYRVSVYVKDKYSIAEADDLKIINFDIN